MTYKKEDRRIRRTRKLLQDALIQLLRQKPLAKIQIKEIVDVADVSRPTFYHHFETKEELLFSHMDDVFEEIRRAVFVDMADGDTVDFLQLLITSFKQWQLHSEALQWVLQVENKDLLIAVLHTHIETLRHEYEKVVPSVTIQPQFGAYAGHFISGGLYMLLKSWIDNGLQESAETMGTLAYLLISSELFQMRYSHLQEGIGGEQRRSEFEKVRASILDLS
ncbi:MAG: TetR/AcrR family transcriptional regulator [Chloroflexota bacterium]